MASEYPAWSPYNYTLNNPGNVIDPNGMASWQYTGEEARQVFKMLRDEYNRNRDRRDADPEPRSCVGLSCGSGNTSSREHISDRFAGLAEKAKNDPWAAAGAFYAASSSITGAEHIATMEGRGFATARDEARAGQIFFEGALMFTPVASISRARALGYRLVGGTKSNWIGVVKEGTGQLLHIGRHPLPKRDLLRFGKTAASKLRSKPLLHIGIRNKHHPLNPLLYLQK